MRKVVVVICLVTIGGLFIGVARQSLGATNATAGVVDLEADGAAMLHPMTTLLTELVTAQSAAVRGDRVQQETVRTAMSALFEPDAQYGVVLQTDQRLEDLRAQIEAAFSVAATGSAAYATWSAIVDLAVDLMRVIGDTSHLVHDPDLDSYYLMEAAIVRLPDTMVAAGRAADVVELAGGNELAGEDLVRAAVLRFNVADHAERVSDGLLTSVDFTANSQLGTSIAPRLDEFRAAADAFSPPTMLHDLATEVDAATMADNASLVFAKAAQLSHLLLTELQTLLQVRADDLARQQRSTLIAGAAGGVLAVVILWLVAVSGRRDGGPSVDEPSTHVARGFASVGFQRGARDAAASGSRDMAGTGARRSGNAQ